MRVAFWGNFGTLNLGNECTLAAAVHNIRARLPDAGLIAICRNPEDAARRHGIEAIPMIERRHRAQDARHPKVWRILRHITREAGAWADAFRHASGIDALLITGCGILTDHDEGTLGLPYELFKWSLVTKLRRKKLFFVSVGVETIVGRLSWVFVKSALRLADYRSYRDQHSVQRLQRLGFRADRDVVCPDLAFSLPEFTAASRGSPACERGGLQRHSVAVGVYNYRGRGHASRADAAAYQAYLDKICSLILWLLAHEYAVRVIIGDFVFDEEVRLGIRAELAKRGLEPTKSPLTDVPATSYEQLLEQLSGVDFAIASRYHNLILALLLGKPVISLSYEAKNEALMSDMGLGDYCQKLDDVNLELLLDQFKRLQSNADSLRATVAGKVAANQTSLGEQYDLMVRIVCGSAGVRT